MHESLEISSAIFTVERGINKFAIFRTVDHFDCKPFQNGDDIWRPGRHAPTQNLLEYSPRVFVAVI